MNVAVLLAFATYALFSAGDAAIKGLGDTPMSTFEISFFAALFSGLAMLFLRPKGERRRDVFRVNHPWLLLIRSVSGLCAGVLGVVSLTTIPFAETYALIFMAPFLVTLMSLVILRERISWLGICAMVLGFAGVLLAVRPGFRVLELGHITAAAAAFFVALSTIIIRRIASSEKRTSLLLMPQLVTAIGSGLIMTTHFVPPTAMDIGLLLISGAFIALAQLTLILASQKLPAATIGQAQFSQLIWAIVLGALFFAEAPDGWSVAGVVVIIVAGLLTLRDRRGA
jgi:drug/metabolite transporter (DMT)-like permease